MNRGWNRDTTLASVALVALLGLGVAGCASSSSAKSDAPPPTSVDAPANSTTEPTAAVTSTTGTPDAAAAGACTLVTEQEASTALGSPAGVGVSKTQGDSSQCVYGTGALIVTSNPQGKTAYDQGHAAITAAPAGSWSDVNDLGDAAFTSHGGPVVSVEFYKGPTLVSIILSGSTVGVPTDAAITVAKAAAGRL